MLGARFFFFRHALLLAPLFFLVHCSTPHTPITFDPYFGQRQPGYAGSDLLSELAVAEAKVERTPLEKKRLYDLYQAELSYLKPGTARHASLLATTSALKGELEEWDTQKSEVERQTKEIQRGAESKAGPVPTPIDSAEWRRAYSEVLSLWNKDQQEAALKKLDVILAGNMDGASKSDRNKFLQIRFRIALENGELAKAGETYAAMKGNESCGYETSVSGFVYSLILLGEGKGKEAGELLESVCEIDDSPAEQIRRDYWRARMMEQTDPAAARGLYEKLARLPIPGYHTFLALMHLNQSYTLLPPVEGQPPRPYLTEEIKVKSAIHEDWLKAEERLRSRLRRDAQVYLSRASTRLRAKATEEDVPAMLYTAHLFHAAGNHLEAMKLYSEVATVLASDSAEGAREITPTILHDMFPRPFPGKADWISDIWKMDPDFVYAIARQESAFNPTAVSATDARGWMQLMPTLAKSIAKTWGLDGKFSDRYLFHVDENLKFGVFHLRQLQDLLGHPALIAAAYNAGASRAINWQKRYGHYPLDIFIELVPITETRNYMKLVLRNYYSYKAIRLGAVDPKVVSFTLAPKTALP